MTVSRCITRCKHRADYRLRRRRAVNGPSEADRSTSASQYIPCSQTRRPVHGPFAAQRLFGPAFTPGFGSRCEFLLSHVSHARSRAFLRLLASAFKSSSATKSISKNNESEIHLHLTWHTKQSAALLIPSVEAFVHRRLRKQIMDTPGAFVREIGGMETRIHLAITISLTVVGVERLPPAELTNSANDPTKNPNCISVLGGTKPW
jgi:hypothetical protein